MHIVDVCTWRSRLFISMTASNPELSPRILVICNDEPARAKTCELLRKADFDVYDKTCIADTISCVYQIRPDIVVIDLPGDPIDTLSTCGLLRGNRATSKIPILCVVDDDSGDDVRAIFQSGGSDYVVRPLTQSALASRCNAIVATIENQPSFAFGSTARRSKYLGLIDRNELAMEYQPQIDTVTGHVRGLEAFLRIQNLDLQNISTTDFIAQAQVDGSIVTIGEWVLRNVCKQTKSWQDEGIFIGRISVNVSEYEFLQPGFRNLLSRIIEESDIDPYMLELEITESVLLDDFENISELIREIKSLGVRIAIDDFGTGFSSLNHLKRSPIERLKIDQSFIADITSNPDDAAIASAIISVANSFGVDVIAEGVETRGQMSYLLDHGCREVQGSLYCSPLPASDVTQYLKQNVHFVEARHSSNEVEKSVLFLDDDELILDAVRCILEEDDFQVYTTSDPRKAFDLLAQHRINVLVVDYQMPNMLGTEFLNRTRQLFPNTIRIMLSGESDMDSIIQAVNTGEIFRFLKKPVSWEVLSDSLEAAFATVKSGVKSSEIKHHVL